MLRRRDIDFEVKELDETGLLTGYASVFGNEDLYGDIIAKGAFRKSLKSKRSPAMLWQHKTDEPIGVWTSMEEDEHGLLANGKLVLDTQRGAEAYALIKAGAIRGLSIGFNVVNYKIDSTTQKRTLTEIDLWETSLVTFPANTEAQIGSVRAALNEGRLPTPREFEEFLRDGGFSAKQAKAIVATGLGESQLRDDVGDGARYAAEALHLIILSATKEGTYARSS